MFSVLIPPRLLKKIKHPPIALQFLPSKKECSKKGAKDPLDEKAYKKGNLLKKYQSRALLLCTNNCAMHCRFCFRRYQAPLKEDFTQELQLIEQDKTLSEIILSGGDPLTLAPKKLQELFSSLEAIPHIKRIRIHSRLPIGYPERLEKFVFPKKVQLYFVLHTNHPLELDDEVLLSLKKLSSKMPILSQSVLLKGVNDNIITLKALFELLVDNGIIPYYLHQLDEVQGAAHFKVPPFKGRQLIQELRGLLSGYAIPRYVKEISGAKSKTLL